MRARFALGSLAIVLATVVLTACVTPVTPVKRTRRGERRPGAEIPRGLKCRCQRSIFTDVSTDPTEATRQPRTLIGPAIACSMTRLSTVDEQRARLARRVSQFAVSGASGFTLVELLVTIVILGVLSGVVIFAVGGMQSQSRTSACAADRTALETAMESYRAINGAYGTEAQLVAAGQLRSESTMYDIALGSNGDFTLLPVGPCAGDELVAAASDPSAAHVSPPSTPTSTAPPSTTTTTAPPATTTTTRALRAATLASACTDPSHWPNQRAWQIKNPNRVAVLFTLDAANATNHAGHHVEGDASPGTTTWYLPAADHGKNTVILDATGRQQSKNSTNRRC